MKRFLEFIDEMYIEQSRTKRWARTAGKNQYDNKRPGIPLKRSSTTEPPMPPRFKLINTEK